ncbi:MAG: hypothetical protein J2P25_05350 [Nocardiopsaceae bacterium]|nr:hypothetical protein [Nocardiopsaceae bacterium]
MRNPFRKQALRKLTFRKRTLALAAAGAVILAAAGAGASYGAGAFSPGTLGNHVYGKQPNGSYLTETGQYLTPAGQVIKEQGRPFGLALSPDGKTAAALNTGGTNTSGVVTIFDLASHKVLQQTGSGTISNGGILYSKDGSHLWLALTTKLLDYTVNPDGTLAANPKSVALPNGPGGRAAVPAGLAWAPDGSLLVTLSTDNSLGVVDPSTDTFTKQIPVGNVPNDVVVAGGNAYVSNEGGHPAKPGEQTDDSYGTPIATQSGDEIPTSGTVSEVDLASGKQVKTFTTGLEPNAETVQGNDVIVANADSDSVTTIDTAKQQVGATFSADPAPGSPYGAQPDDVAFLNPTTLAVSLGRYNAIALYGYHDAYSQPSFEGLIPAGYYPSGLAFDSQLGKLVIGDEQGLGSVGTDGTVPEGTGTTPKTSHLGYNFEGTVQLVSPPSRGQLATYTQQVFSDNQWNGLLQRNAKANANVKPAAVPLHLGQPSKIKHVFLIVRENRTYDQVLGDIGRGNSDPALAQFGKNVTPNAHALATQFPLIDNFYSAGTNSAEGHNWIDQGLTNNYMQQMYGNWTRSYQTDDPLHNNPTGYMWTDAVKHGKTVTNWGEDADNYVNTSGNSQVPPINWQKFYHDSQVLEGKASGPLNYPIGDYTTTTDLPSLRSILQPDYPPFNLDIPDQYRADLFQREFANYVKNNNLPQLNMMWLPDDHTDGTSPGLLTPQAEVADNDLALGRIIDTISHSKYWKDSAIFVEEDDSQNGVDHVDGHRNIGMVISPYAKHGGYVDSSYYSQMNIDRTIEQILGIPPMTEDDLVATPMFNSFTDTPNDAPYNYLPNQIPLTQANPSVASITNPVQKAWAKWAAKQDYKSEDMVPMAASNRDIWYSNTGWKTPYPGDSKVLLPSQVPGGDTLPPGTKPDAG